MSKFMGTPGPWERKNGGLTDKDGRDVFFRSVANLCSGCDESIKESEANTTLASAAPDLLEASIMAIEHYDAYFKGSEPPEDLPWVPVMRAAITKATGEAQ